MAAKGKYAVDTRVGSEASLNEIRALVKKYDGGKFGFIEDEQSVGIAFELNGRRVRFMLPLPTRDDAVATVGNQYQRAGQYDAKRHEQLIRQRWRGLVIAIKGKLESWALGIETFDAAFMAQLVLPSGQTMEEWAAPHIHAAYERNAMPPLLPSGGG